MTPRELCQGVSASFLLHFVKSMALYWLPVECDGPDVLLLSAMSLPARISANVRYWMDVKGFDQTELATKSGLSQGFISMLLNGKRGVAIENLDNVARAFEIDVVELTIDPDRRTVTDTGGITPPPILSPPEEKGGSYVFSADANHPVQIPPEIAATIANDVLKRVGLAITVAAAAVSTGSGEPVAQTVQRPGQT